MPYPKNYIPTVEELEKWRIESKDAMQSGLPEYCPEEFGVLLDYIETLKQEIQDIKDDIIDRAIERSFYD